MEKIAAELRESKLKQSNLGKAYQSAHALVSSLIVASVQWEDLEGHLESTRSSIEARFRELELREAEIGARLAQVEAKESDFDSKADEARGLEDLLEQKLKEVINSKNHLHSLQSLIREHSDEVLIQEKRLETVEGFVREKEREYEFVEKQVKERTRKLNLLDKSLEEKTELAGQLSEIRKDLELKEELTRVAQRSIEDCDKELMVKEEKLGSIRKSLAECRYELESKERRVREIESKERDFVVVKKSLEEWSCELELKEREIGAKETKLESKEKQVREVQKSIRDGEMHLDAMSKGLQKKESELADQARELALKKKEFDSIRKTTEERSENLKTKERQLEDREKEIVLKQKEFAAIELERRILTFRENKLELKAKELESKQKEFDSVKKSTEEQAHNLKVKEGQLEDQAKGLEVKQKILDSVKKSVEEQIQILKASERQLEVQAEDLELKQKELDSMKESLEVHARNLKSKENNSILLSQVKVEPLEYIPSNHAVGQRSTNLDGRGLQLFMNKHLKGIDSASSEITARLQASTDPAKLVLDAMQGFYPSHVAADNMDCDFDLGIIRRSCIVLLETLKRVSPQITPQVKEEAIKLACDWKAKMITEPENWLEVLGFLRLVTIYDITSDYDANELQSLIAIVGENEQATELSQAVTCTEMESTSIICSPVKTEEPESSLAKDAGTEKDVATASQNLQLTAPALQTSLEPAKLLDVMQRSFAEYWKMNDVRSKESAMLVNIYLLEQVGAVSNFGAQVEIDALKLAFLWKHRIKADTSNPLELLGFVQFTAKFGIVAAFGTDDILMFLGMISEHKQTREVCQTLVLADKIPADYVQNLIDKKPVIEAVRVICTFKFGGTQPPVPLLEGFVQGLKKHRIRARKPPGEKVKAIDYKISTLRDVIQCINDCNLESEYPPSEIENYIAALEKTKENLRLAATQQIKPPPTMVVQHQQQQSKDVVPNVDQQELNQGEHRIKRRWNQVPVQEQHQNKFQRTSGPAAASPINTQNPQDTYTNPGQYGAAPNGNGLGSNCGPAQQFTDLGMPPACHYRAGALPNPRMHPPYPHDPPSITRYGPYQV